MEIAWFIAPYITVKEDNRIVRYCAINDFTEQIIVVEGGMWAESEVENNKAVVKVKASTKTLDKIRKLEGFIELPDLSSPENVEKLDFSLTRKRPVYDKDQDKIIFVGEEVESKSIALLNDEVK